MTAKGQAVAEQEQQAQHEAAEALLFERRGRRSTPPRRPTTGQCGASPVLRAGAASLLLAFASEGLIGAGDAEPASPASAIAPVPAASADAPPAASTASAGTAVWLVLAQCACSQQVRSIVHNHVSLFAWGGATVLELEDGSGGQARCLCVEGRWSAVDELAANTAAPSKWSCMC